MRRCSLDDGFGSLSSKHAPKHLKPITGVLPSVKGESWFGVLVTSNSPLFTTNQAQPEPKRVAPALRIFL